MLFDVTDPNSPVSVASAAFPANNVNTNASGRAVFADNVPGHALVVYALATNNGILAQITQEKAAIQPVPEKGSGEQAER